MAGIFNRAYDQANRILNGSGLSSIVYQQDGGPVIRRFMGGYTDAHAGVEETVSDTFDMSDWSRGGDILGGGLTPKQAQGMTDYIYGKDPGADDSIKKGLQRLALQKMNQPGGPDYSEEDILRSYYESYPMPSKISEIGLEGLAPLPKGPAKEYQKLWDANLPKGLNRAYSDWLHGVQKQVPLPPQLSSKSYDDQNIVYSENSPQNIMDNNRRAEENRLAKESGHKSFQDLLYDEGKKMGYSFSGDKWKDATKLRDVNKTSPLALSIEQKLRDKNLDAGATWRPLEKFKEAYRPTNEELSKIPYGALLATDPGIGKWEGQMSLDELMRRSVYPSQSMNLATGGKVMPGGLSGINKSININGQPHSLAWINPGEASALKAMGGSGKKVGGIPAYDFEGADWMGGEDLSVVSDPEPTVAEQISSYMDEGGADIMGGTRALDRSTDQVADRNTEAKNRRPYRGEGDSSEWRYVTGGFGDLDPGEVGNIAYSSQIPTNDFESTLSDDGSPLTKLDLEEGNYTNRAISILLTELAPSVGWDKAYDAVLSLGRTGINDFTTAYHTGYTGGGILGTYEYLSDKIGTQHAKDLGLKKLTGKETKKEKESILKSYEKEAKRLGGTFERRIRFGEDGFLGKDFVKTAKEHGWSPLMTTGAQLAAPGNFLTKGLGMAANFIGDMAGRLGVFTDANGKSFAVTNDGSLIEDDIYTPSQSDNDPMVSIQKPRPVQQASVSEEVDKPLTGIAALQQERSEVASIAERLQPQFDNIASIFGREEAAKMLNLPENIFA